MPNAEQAMTDVTTPAPNGEPMEEKSSGTSLPDEVLKIPALNAVIEGSPPAVFAPATLKSPELKTLEKNIENLKNAGFGFYRTKDKENVVMFNALFITPEELKQADESGQLESIAAPFDEVNTALSVAFQDGKETAAAPPATPAAGNPPPASAQRNLMTKRVNNVQPGSPTSGARPGQGRLLNNIQKPVI